MMKLFKIKTKKAQAELVLAAAILAMAIIMSLGLVFFKGAANNSPQQVVYDIDTNIFLINLLRTPLDSTILTVEGYTPTNVAEFIAYVQTLDDSKKGTKHLELKAFITGLLKKVAGPNPTNPTELLPCWDMSIGGKIIEESSACYVRSEPIITAIEIPSMSSEDKKSIPIIFTMR